MSDTVSPAAAYNAAKELPWLKTRRQVWAVKKCQKFVSKVGHAKGLAEQIITLRALGLEGRALKRPFVRALKGWRKAWQGSIGDQAKEAAQAVAQVTGQAIDKGLELAKDPTVQAAVNAALVAAGLPPIAWSSTATAEESLAVWQATTTEPLPAEDDPDLAEGSSSSKSSGGLLAAAAGALVFLPRLLGR